MLVLADYHNTETKSAYPSLRTLATESLMSPRNASRVIKSLVGKGFLRRQVGVGRGVLTEYEIAGLDFEKQDNLSSFSGREKMTQKMTNTAKKVDTTGIAIRKEPKATGSLEPGLSETVSKIFEQERQSAIARAKARGFIVSEDGQSCYRPRPV